MLLEDLNVFTVAAQTQNFRSAGEILGLTQPAISKAIHRLENILGSKLFERNSRGVTLTRMGRAALERSRSINSIVDLMKIEVADMNAAETGLVRLGSNPSVIDSIVVPSLSGLSVGKSSVRIELHIQLSRGLIAELQAGTLDMAIATVPHEIPSDLNYEIMASAKSFIVARRGHPLFSKRFTMEDLSKQKWLILPADVVSEWLFSFFTASNLSIPPFAVQVDASPHIFSSLIANSDLLTYMTENMLAEKTTTGVVPLPPPAPVGEIQMGLFWRRHAVFSTAMKRCRTEIRKSFAKWDF